VGPADADRRRPLRFCRRAVGEALEAYRVRFLKTGGIWREATVPSPEWIYVVALQATDDVVAPCEIEVAQISDHFGPGLFRRVSIDV
jgi:hypothetical protein